MENLNSDCWIVASTHPHKENAALDNLRRQGFQVYCPFIRRRIHHSRRVKNALRPLFAGYVFVQLDTQRSQWRPILSTIGVRSVIRFGDRFGILPATFVDNLRSHEQDGAIPPPRAKDSYVPGELVRVREGPFEGFIAKVLICDQQERLHLLMNMLNRSVRIQISLDQVAPAKIA